MQIRTYNTSDRASIGVILNHEILHSASFYHTMPMSEQQIIEWVDKKLVAGRPILIAEQDGQVQGFATFDTFRNKPACRLTVEHSVYVHPDFRGRGVGRLLLESIIHEAANQGFHTMIGAIDSENLPSLELHKKMGFDHCGTLRQVAFKFDRWLDLVFVQRHL